MKFKTLIVIPLVILTTQLYGQFVYITRFGAKEGKNNNAVAIQKAIDKCALKGGVVLVPPGNFTPELFF
jgi:polygalacturonase